MPDPTPVTARRVADATPLEAAYIRAMHDLDCGPQGAYPGSAGPVDHPVEDHEPFDQDEGDIPWSSILKVLADRGVVLTDEEGLRAAMSAANAVVRGPLGSLVDGTMAELLLAQGGPGL